MPLSLRTERICHCHSEQSAAQPRNPKRLPWRRQPAPSLQSLPPRRGKVRMGVPLPTLSPTLPVQKLLETFLHCHSEQSASSTVIPSGAQTRNPKRLPWRRQPAPSLQSLPPRLSATPNRTQRSRGISSVCLGAASPRPPYSPFPHASLPLRTERILHSNPAEHILHCHPEQSASSTVIPSGAQPPLSFRAERSAAEESKASALAPPARALLTVPSPTPLCHSEQSASSTPIRRSTSSTVIPSGAHMPLSSRAERILHCHSERSAYATVIPSGAHPPLSFRAERSAAEESKASALAPPHRALLTVPSPSQGEG